MQVSSIEDLKKIYEEYDGAKGGWISVAEGQMLYALTYLIKAQAVYECGTCDGWSTMWMALALEHLEKELGGERKVHTWDIVSKPGLDEGTNLHSRIVRHIGPFHQGVGLELAKKKNEDHVLAFIDGDHSYNACSMDARTVMRWLGDEDLLVFHDTRGWKRIPVRYIITSILTEGGYEGLILKSMRGLGIVKKEYDLNEA